jgi:hypothetical protein
VPNAVIIMKADMDIVPNEFNIMKANMNCAKCSYHHENSYGHSAKRIFLMPNFQTVSYSQSPNQSDWAIRHKKSNWED